MDWYFRCLACDATAPPDEPHWRCPDCGGELAIEGLASGVSADGDGTGLWTFAGSLPVGTPDAGTILGEGNTPLIPFDLDGVTIHLKLDSLLPTGSFKDRGAAVLSKYLQSIGVRRIIVDSSGNAAAAMAAYAAATGLDCTVYVPASASPGKLVQARAYGARVIPVEGSRDDVASAAQTAADSDPASSYASHNWHPVFVEGVKTWAMEVYWQLDGRNPDVAFVPTGGGSAYVGAWRGFNATAGETRLVACQPDACAPIVHAWSTGGSITPVEQGQTIAEGTRIAMPSRPKQIQRALEDSNGWATAVDEELLIETLRLLWSRGVYAEPTAALGVAACRMAIAAGEISGNDVVVAHVTGNGLKATPLIDELLNDR